MKRVSRAPLTLLLLLGPWGLQAIPQSEQPATMTGRIVDAGDNPLAGAEVALVPTDYRGRNANAFTNERGNYRLESIAAGSYRVRVRKAGLAVYGIEAAATGGSEEPAWEISGPPPDDGPTGIPIEAGQSIRFDVVMRASSESEVPPYVPRMDRLTGMAQQGLCARALPLLEDYLAGFPGKAAAYYLLGYCQANLGHAEQGVAALRRALELRPGMPGTALLVGQVLIGLGQTEEATVWLRREIDEGQDDRMKPEAWLALGLLYRDGGKPEEAIGAFEQVVALAPRQPQPYAELAQLYVQSGRLDKAEETLLASAQAGAVDIGSLLNIGIAYYNDKNYDRASKVFGRSIELATSDDERAMAYALLGRCRAREGHSGEAATALRKSLELDPDGKFAEECREILKQM